MMHQKMEVPGLDRTRTRFFHMLQNRQAALANHALIAWESDKLHEINGNLARARNLLGHIAGTAGSLGFHDLGKHARIVETAIDDHLSGVDADLAICPAALIIHLDHFVQHCQTLIAANPDLVEPAQ